MVESRAAIAKVNGELLRKVPKDLFIPPDALSVFLDAFEGPLDLLLYLIKKQKLDILQLPMQQITAQYMGYINMMSSMQLEMAGEYLVMAAMLAEKPSPDLRGRPYRQKPYWHIERARLGETRKVPVEVVVNGEAVLRKDIVADGTLRDFSAGLELKKSSWVALRILPSAHTNPIFVIVAGKPIRASAKSATRWTRFSPTCAPPRSTSSRLASTCGPRPATRR